MAGYPRVIGYHPGLGYTHPGVAGYVAGGYVAGAPMLAPVGAPPGFAPPWMHQAPMGMPVHPAPGPSIQSAPWRPMVAPGTPPVQEGHVPMPLNPETFNGTWGGAAGAPSGAQIIFSGRPQKPFKPARLIVRGTKSGATAIGNMVGQGFVGTDLQQGELGNIDLESIGAATAFDTWLSWKQAEPGVWVRVQATLTAFPTSPDFETYTITMMGHYLH